MRASLASFMQLIHETLLHVLACMHSLRLNCTAYVSQLCAISRSARSHATAQSGNTVPADLRLALLPRVSTGKYLYAGTQAASATGAARASAHDAVRRAEENLQAAKAKAAETAGSTYEATKGKAHGMYLAGHGTAQAALEEAEAAAKAAREKVPLIFLFDQVSSVAE